MFDGTERFDLGVTFMQVLAVRHLAMALYAWRGVQKGKTLWQQGKPAFQPLLQYRSAGTHAENTNTFIKEVRTLQLTY